MAAAKASAARDGYAEILSESVRQLRNYIGGNQPIPRLIRTKIDRVIADREMLVAAHHTYAEKAEVQIGSQEMRTYITQKTDDATTVIDEAEMKLDTEASKREVRIEKEELETFDGALRSTMNSL